MRNKNVLIAHNENSLNFCVHLNTFLHLAGYKSVLDKVYIFFLADFISD